MDVMPMEYGYTRPQAPSPISALPGASANTSFCLQHRHAHIKMINLFHYVMSA